MLGLKLSILDNQDELTSVMAEVEKPLKALCDAVRDSDTFRCDRDRIELLSYDLEQAFNQMKRFKILVDVDI